MRKVKITVLRKTIIEDLAKEYGVEGLSKCPMLKEGQVFYADYAKPDGFCDEAWKAIEDGYATYKVKDASEILPQFLYMQFARPEVDRLGWFLSDGSIRSNLDWDRFCTIQIPLPPLEVQQSIVNLYHCIEEAKSIARETRERLTTLCPALVQYAINA